MRAPITPRLAFLIFVALQVPFALRMGRNFCMYAGSSSTGGSGAPSQQQQQLQQQHHHQTPLVLSSNLRKPTGSAMPAVPTDASTPVFPQHLKELYKYRAPLPKSEEQQAAFQEECGADAPHYAAFFQQSSRRRSYLNEDKIVYELFFKDRTPGDMKEFKYVEMGGFDGMDASNSRFFEACLSWEGLLVEPNPRPFERLERNRLHAHVASYAASCSYADADRNATIAFNDYPYPNARQADTTNSYTGRHETQVPCGPLTPVIRDALGDRVHFMSLDVEGAEPLVLANLDFDAVRIDVLLVEVINPFCPVTEDCASRQQTRTILKERGYHRFENLVKNSDLYVHPQSPFLAKMEGMVVASEE